MSYIRRTRTNLLNNDRFADNKRFDSHFSGARKERDRGDVRGIDRHRAAEAPRDLGVERTGPIPARSIRNRAFRLAGARGR